MSGLELLVVLFNVATVVLVGFVLVPFLKEKGYVNEENAKQTVKLLEIARLIIKEMNIKDQKKNTAIDIFIVAEKAVKYVEQTMKYDSNEQKKELAIELAIDVLKHTNIKVTKDIEQIIEIGIESAVNALPKTYK